MAGITVKEIDGSPTILNVIEIRVPVGTLTNPSAGVAELTVTASGVVTLSVADKIFLNANFQ
jgi:hypothetical protein